MSPFSLCLIGLALVMLAILLRAPVKLGDEDKTWSDEDDVD